MEFDLQAIGYLSAIFLALCALPEALRAFVNKKSDIGLGMLSMWLIGEILGLIYVIPMGKMPLTLNYCLNIILISVILYYRLYPEEENDD